MRKKWVHGAATFDNQCKTSGCFSGSDLELFRMTTDRPFLVSQVDIPENGEGPTDDKIIPVSNKPGVFAQSLSPLVQFMQYSPRRV